MSLLIKLRSLFRHKHRWTGTRQNAWFIETEQKCKCGAYRHHLFADLRLGDEPIWREGRHPRSLQDEREQK